MLRFLAVDGDEPARERALEGAYLIGPDHVPVAGEVGLSDGIIDCRKGTRDAAALAIRVVLDATALERIASIPDHPLPRVPFPLTPLGELTMRTCLLPDRDRPYLLSLELARHQLMLFLNKLEDWQLTDLPPAGPVMSLFEAARSSFTEALVARGDRVDGPMHGYTSSADALACRALWLATEAGERLTLLSAARDFEPRATGRMYQAVADQFRRGNQAIRQGAPLSTSDRIGVVVAGRPAVGCGVSPTPLSEPLCRALTDAVDFIALRTRWIDLEPAEGEYRFTPTDRWIEWAVRNANLPVIAGPLIDFHPGAAPEWLYIWENDYETLRELVYEHVKAVVTRYRRTVNRWTVASGLHVTSHFRLNFDQIMDLTRIAVLTVRKLAPGSRLQVELVEPWGESFATGRRRGLAPMMYAEMINQTGMPVDAFSLRVCMGATGAGPGGGARDLMEFAAMLDRYATLERPIALSAVGVPSRPPAPRPTPANGQTPPAPRDDDDLAAARTTTLHARPGSWRGPWSDTIQADWITSALGLALSRPFVETVCWHELTDQPRGAELESGGLLSLSGEPKPGLERLAELRRAAQARETPPRLATLQRQTVGDLM